MSVSAMSVSEIIAVHPSPASIDRDALVACIDECFTCAPTCTSCADASLAEDDIGELVRCIRTCLDCADVCVATGSVLARQTAFATDVPRAALEACIEACRVCAEECERHAAHHEHCRICAEECRRCERACREVLRLLG
jgi:hypothetical protein